MSKDIIISMIEVGRVGLERTAKAVPEDKLNWKPLDNGRTVLDLLGDAAQAPALCTGMLRGNIQYGPELFKRMAQERATWTREEALNHLAENTRQLIEEIKTFPDEKLDEPLTLPMGGGMTLAWGVWILMAYRSFMSRTAQINYIQTLYGDFESH
ncbi:MAG: DinB family protein [Abitibacteriaceae bacterium]|nr:DinB family protein [Abditibacteriaceae bacterium]MBV9868190.1 DinB family protein [Abditibacteriaceae bacterium]